MPVDYSLYLVTDNTRTILGDRKLEDVVKAAVEGGMLVLLLEISPVSNQPL